MEYLAVPVRVYAGNSRHNFVSGTPLRFRYHSTFLMFFRENQQVSALLAKLDGYWAWLV